MRKVNSVLLTILGALVFYQYRYRLMNAVLSSPAIRHQFIQLSMRIPFIRNKFMFRVFR
ncbi:MULTISPECIES: hypothetical protein [Metabacillus]|uniref:hypothetical protein n=1 Tax=Metabacillus TaxID=2675233 RepID=UPI000AEA9CC2|nr:MULTISPECIES: hypothetical protein [Metabacillus]MDX8291152.1 hypothetical protein [Metabacillus indicus]